MCSMDSKSVKIIGVEEKFCIDFRRRVERCVITKLSEATANFSLDKRMPIKADGCCCANQILGELDFNHRG